MRPETRLQLGGTEVCSEAEREVSGLGPLRTLNLHVLGWGAGTHSSTEEGGHSVHALPSNSEQQW